MKSIIVKIVNAKYGLQLNASDFGYRHFTVNASDGENVLVLDDLPKKRR